MTVVVGTHDFLVSAGESDSAVRLNLLWLVSVVPTLIVAAHLGGITGVAAGHVIALAVVVLPAHLAALHRLGVTAASIEVISTLHQPSELPRRAVGEVGRGASA